MDKGGGGGGRRGAPWWAVWSLVAIGVLVAVKSPALIVDTIREGGTNWTAAVDANAGDVAGSGSAAGPVSQIGASGARYVGLLPCLGDPATLAADEILAAPCDYWTTGDGRWVFTTGGSARAQLGAIVPGYVAGPGSAPTGSASSPGVRVTRNWLIATTVAVGALLVLRRRSRRSKASPSPGRYAVDGSAHLTAAFPTPTAAGSDSFPG